MNTAFSLWGFDFSGEEVVGVAFARRSESQWSRISLTLRSLLETPTCTPMEGN